MSIRNSGDSVNNSSCGLVVYRITTIPSWHNFYIRETQLSILYVFFQKFQLCAVCFGCGSFNLFYCINLLVVGYIEDIQIFCWIWLIFHRVKWKIFIFHEWRSHEWNIHIFHFTSEIKDIFNKTFEFSFYYIQPIWQRGENFNIHKLTLISTQSSGSEYQNMPEWNQIKWS